MYIVGLMVYTCTSSLIFISAVDFLCPQARYMYVVGAIAFLITVITDLQIKMSMECYVHVYTCTYNYMEL